MEKPLVDLTMVIDLEDEIEEEEEWEHSNLGHCATRGRGKGTAENPISLGPRFENYVAQRVDATSPVMMVAVAQGIRLGGRNNDIDDPFAFENDEDAFWKEVAGLETSQRVDAGSLHGNCVDLSSSESGYVLNVLSSWEDS